MSPSTIFFFDAVNGPYWLCVESVGGKWRTAVALADLQAYANNGFMFAHVATQNAFNSVLGRYPVS